MDLLYENKYSWLNVICQSLWHLKIKKKTCSVGFAQKILTIFDPTPLRFQFIQFEFPACYIINVCQLNPIFSDPLKTLHLLSLYFHLLTMHQRTFTKNSFFFLNTLKIVFSSQFFVHLIRCFESEKRVLFDFHSMISFFRGCCSGRHLLTT